MDRRSEILDLCAAAEHILYQIPLRAAPSPEEYFAMGNLWSLEIESTCSQIIAPPSIESMNWHLCR